MTTLPIIELIAYAIIGLASSLFAGGALFLGALNVYERLEDWWLQRRSRKAAPAERTQR